MNMFEKLSDGSSDFFLILFGLLVLLALIRMVIKFCKGEKISTKPNDALKDLPGSVTGLNRYEDDK